MDKYTGCKLSREIQENAGAVSCFDLESKNSTFQMANNLINQIISTSNYLLDGLDQKELLEGQHFVVVASSNISYVLRSHYSHRYYERPLFGNKFPNDWNKPNFVKQGMISNYWHIFTDILLEHDRFLIGILTEEKTLIFSRAKLIDFSPI